jgi:hypothetical protein
LNYDHSSIEKGVKEQDDKIEDEPIMDILVVDEEVLVTEPLPPLLTTSENLPPDTTTTVVSKSLSERFFAAAKQGDTQAVRAYIAKGADVHKRDRSWWSAMHWAAFNGSTDLAIYLQQAGVSLHSVDHVLYE